MAWPNTRLTTYGAASPVKSADLNAIQDAIIAGQHGDRTLHIAPLGGFVYDTTIWSPNVLGGYLLSIAAGHCFCSLPLRQGDRLKSVTFARFGNGVADFNNVDIFKMSAAGVRTSIINAAVTNPAAAWTDTTLDPADYTVAAGEALYLDFEGNASSLRIGSTRVVYDHP